MRPRECIVCEATVDGNRLTCSSSCLNEANRRTGLALRLDGILVNLPASDRLRRNGRRWAAMVLEEVAAGRGYTTRLGRRWRLNHRSAHDRIGYLVANGYLDTFPRPTPAPCGTPAAYQRHHAHGEAPCPACRAAWAADVKRRRSA